MRPARNQMTSKTKRTLALVDALAGVPDQRACWPRLVVPYEAFTFMLDHVILTVESGWDRSGMVFQMDYRFRQRCVVGKDNRRGENEALEAQ
jgi:hypothetical protein